MQIPVLVGRPLTWSDVHDRRPVVAVAESFARHYWEDPGEAIGKRISTGRRAGESGWREIVGVVGDVRDDGLHVDPPELTYWPMVTPNPWEAVEGVALLAPRDLSYAFRSSRSRSPELLQEVRRAIASVNSHLAVDEVAGMDLILSRSMARTSFTLTMLGVAAAMALLIATVGVYGMIAYLVSNQTREIGIRMALGAERLGVIRLILRRGFLLAVFGVALGSAGACGLTGMMARFLFGVSPLDPATYAAVALIIISTALLASYLPARRAASVDPTEALRIE
jgi:hypothetical protein